MICKNCSAISIILSLVLAGCGPSEPTAKKNSQQNEEFAKKLVADKKLLTDPNRGVPEFISQLRSRVKMKDGFLTVETLSSFSFAVLSPSSQWTIQCGIGLGVTFGNSHRMVDGPSTACPLLAAEGSRTCDDVRTALNTPMNERVTKQIFGRALSSVLLTMLVLNAIAG
jgi:hypothetical protein